MLKCIKKVCYLLIRFVSHKHSPFPHFLLGMEPKKPPLTVGVQCTQFNAFYKCSPLFYNAIFIILGWENMSVSVIKQARRIGLNAIADLLLLFLQ